MMKKCLLIVDVQKGFVNESTEHIPKLVEKLQYDYEYVVASKFINQENSPYRRFIKWNKFGVGTEDIDLAFELKADSVVVEKFIYTCIDESFVNYLMDNNITQVDICGIDTDICVTKCAVDLFELGIDARVIANHCASHAGMKAHENALRTLERFIGKGQLM